MQINVFSMFYYLIINADSQRSFFVLGLRPQIDRFTGGILSENVKDETVKPSRANVFPPPTPPHPRRIQPVNFCL